MTNSNFQITTREYKLMLNTKRFKRERKWNKSISENNWKSNRID